MRRIFVSLLLAAACASTALAGGCSSNKNGGSPDASADAYGVHVMGDGAGSPDSEGEDAGEEATPPVQTTMRLAHASPDLGPIDFCWRQTGAAAFLGPVLGNALPPPDAGAHAEGNADSASDSAAPPGELVFGAMSPDVQLPSAGTFDIAVVPGGQMSCATHRLVGTVTLDAGKRGTVVLMGLSSQDAGPDALGVVAFVDAPADPQTARVRMIHAALGATDEPATGPLSVRAGVTLVTPEIDPGMTSAPSTAPPVDALGYTTLTPVAQPTPLQLAGIGDAGVGDAAIGKWTTADGDLAVQAGTSHTGVIVSVGQGALGVAWCTDEPNNRGLPACTLLVAHP